MSMDNNSSMNMENAWKDGIMGVVTGDALGSPAQFRSRYSLEENPVCEMIHCEHFRTPAGSWTDDSSLTLATLGSLIMAKGYDNHSIATEFAKWLKEGEYTPFGRAFDIGMGCQRGIDMFLRTGDGTTSGGTNEHNNGNGSLMRIMPMCIYLYYRQKIVCTSESECVHMIEEASAITHGHKRAKMACGLYYFCVKHILDNRDSKTLQECLQEGLDEGFKFYGSDIRNLTETAYYGRLFDLNDFKQVPKSDISTSGYVVDTLEASIWNLITTDSYEGCLIQTVNMGDDADTVGAIAGGLAGLYYGCKAIPERWINAIQRREWIEQMCEDAATLWS